MRAAAGLCDRCRHRRIVRSDRGSRFVLCERSREDRRFPRYPRLPVADCPGFEQEMHDPMTVRTRFAPSPTGELHLGNVRTAILNWLVARHHGGRFVLRFEDTDVERNVSWAEGSILETLDWLGLDRDEDPVIGGPFGPYRQSERLELYRRHAEELLESGLAFRCYCLPEELAERRGAARERGRQPRYDGRCRSLAPADEAALRAEGREPVLRFRVDDGPIPFRDRGRGDLSIDGAEFGDLVILRSDGRPTYNFAVVVDDVAMEITHVIRGIGHLSNTPKQVLLYHALGAEPPEFVHVPMVLGVGGEKLSKRAGARGALEYREAGYHPAAVVNYLSLLSWSSESGEEVLTPDELIERIDLDRLGVSNAILDPEKMRWLSGQHVRREPATELARRLEPFVDRASLELGEKDLLRLAEVERDRIHLFTDAAAEARRIFGPPDLTNDDVADVLAARSASATLCGVEKAWEEVREWTRPSIGEALRAAGRTTGARGRDLFRPVRGALTGRLSGPELPDVAYALGRSRALARLRAARREALA